MNDSETFVDVDATYNFGGASDVSFATLSFADQNARFRSVTINNQSSRLCAVYLDATGSGSPAIAVLPGTFVTQPIASAQYVSLRFFAQAGSVDGGSIYIHGCNTVLSASSGAANAAGGSGGIVFDYSTFDTAGFNI